MGKWKRHGLCEARILIFYLALRMRSAHEIWHILASPQLSTQVVWCQPWNEQKALKRVFCILLWTEIRSFKSQKPGNLKTNQKTNKNKILPFRMPDGWGSVLLKNQAPKYHCQHVNGASMENSQSLGEAHSQQVSEMIPVCCFILWWSDLYCNESRSVFHLSYLSIIRVPDTVREDERYCLNRNVGLGI